MPALGNQIQQGDCPIIVIQKEMIKKLRRGSIESPDLSEICRGHYPIYGYFHYSDMAVFSYTGYIS